MYAYISGCTVSIDRTNHELVFVCDTWNQDGYANGVSRHVIQRVIETKSQRRFLNVSFLVRLHSCRSMA